MNTYSIIALLMLLAGVALAGERYGVYSTEITCQKHEEAQQQVTIAAENSVIATIGKQQTITQEIDHAHHTGITIIDDLYRVQPNTAASGYNMPTLSSSTHRSDGATCKSPRTKYYRLNAQECDDNTAQLIDLQDWLKAQVAMH